MIRMFAVLALFICTAWVKSPAQSPAKSPVSSPVQSESAQQAPSGGGGEPAGCDCLADVIDSVVFELDATDADSYSGSGTTWANLIASPADGAGQTDYDFTNTGYTFNGTAGDAAAYWSTDGGDYFSSIADQTSFMKKAHKTTGGTDFWMALTFAPSTLTSIQTLLNTANGSTVANVGINVQFNATGTWRVARFTGASNSTTNLSGTTQTVANTVIIMSWSANFAEAKYWINSTTTDNTVAPSVAASTLDADSAKTIIGSYQPVPLFGLQSGGKIYSMAVGNEYLDNTKAAAIISYLETKHSRDYTP